MKAPIPKALIVGQEIKSVLRSPWEHYEGCKICDAFIELNNEIVFQLLNCCDDSWNSSRLCAAPVKSTWELAEVHESCAGEVVVGVCTSDYWPSIGVVLSNGLIVHMDAPTTYEFIPVTSVVRGVRQTNDTHRLSCAAEEMHDIWGLQ